MPADSPSPLHQAQTNGQHPDAHSPAEMPPAFDPHPVEARWNAFWNEGGFFAPAPPQPGQKPFCITIPPPNVTGVLHLGHALQHSIHDCLLRYHRMKGEPTLCVPGTDHASISTQIKVRDLIRETEGKELSELGREAFLERAWAWKEKYGGQIIEQMKALGCSYDWARERFTMDEAYTRAVLTVFKKWHDAGHIYRGYRLVNWSPGAQSTVSDLEIDYREVQGSLWHFKYPVEDSQEFITVATTRPETMLGDTAVAVHPDDARYQHLIGKRVLLPLMNRPIAIVADAMVDREFGTGAVKITPAHDPNDYEMGVRHGLEMISVIGFDARMTEAAVVYQGLTREEARVRVVQDLQALGLVEKIEPYTHSVGHAERTGEVIEPLLSEQWFCAMKELARPVLDALKIGRVHYHPERFAQTSLEWLENVRDWCISRQLWWGHRIPVYYGPNGEVEVSVEPITRAGWHQDEDVLDTWFSSALWPFAVLGWPNNLETEWYPTSALITGRDILNLWVSRMILTSLDFVDGEIPFHDVVVHPTVQDAFGLRMSKSLGTGIDPMGLIETYGADATRFGMLQLATATQDVRFLDSAEIALGEPFVRRWFVEHKGEALPLEWNDEPTKRYPQMQQARNFANKIWNASRFVLSSSQLSAISFQQGDAANQDLASRWILSRLNGTIETVTAALDAYEFDAAASALYSFIWGDFCDYFVEVSKPKLRANDAAYQGLILHVLETTLRLLHPFMPFLSEDIWQRLPRTATMMTVMADGRTGGGLRRLPSENERVASLCVAPWPESWGRDAEAEIEFALVQDVIRAARNLRSEAKLPPSQKLSMNFTALSENAAHVLQDAVPYLQQLANLQEVNIVGADAPRAANALSTALPELEIFLPMEGLIDRDKESARLQKELETALKDQERVAAKLSNPQFTSKAPPAVIAKEEAKRDELGAAIEKLRARLQNL